MSEPVSLNLTEHTHALVDAGDYDTPLFITGTHVVMEVVFWSAKFEKWVILVKEHTDRAFPPDGPTREITVGELDYYEAAAGVPHA